MYFKPKKGSVLSTKWLKNSLPIIFEFTVLYRDMIYVYGFFMSLIWLNYMVYTNTFALYRVSQNQKLIQEKEKKIQPLFES